MLTDLRCRLMLHRNYKLYCTFDWSPKCVTSLGSSFSPQSGVNMTAIKIKAVGPVPQEKSRPLFLEVLCRSLIILCTALSIVLSSIAVCDGHWLLSDRRIFGLWYCCTVDNKDSDTPSSCSRHIGEVVGTSVELGLGVCRCIVSFAVVSAIFGLELLVISQVSEGRASNQRWHLGAWLVLLAGGLAAGGTATFVLLLGEYATPLGFTLTFWCQFTATFLFFLNGMAARHIQNMASLLPSRGDPEKL